MAVFAKARYSSIECTYGSCIAYYVICKVYERYYGRPLGVPLAIIFPYYSKICQGSCNLMKKKKELRPYTAWFNIVIHVTTFQGSSRLYTGNGGKSSPIRTIFNSHGSWPKLVGLPNSNQNHIAIKSGSGTAQTLYTLTP